MTLLAPDIQQAILDARQARSGVWIRGGRKVIIAPDGGDVWTPAKPRQDATLIRALARAHRWKRMLEEGRYRSAAEIAEAEGVTRRFVNRLLRLTLLSPDIVETILDAKGMQLEELPGRIPSSWEEQRKPPIPYHPERTRRSTVRISPDVR